jgi:hypothetical protein
MLTSIRDYEKFVYGIQDRYPIVDSSSLVVAPLGATVAKLSGEVIFKNGITLKLLEIIDFAKHKIVHYGYEVYRGQEKLYWYDSMEHPSDKSLASTYPHHKHIPPDIKHHRIPAEGLSFIKPNLDFLIEEITHLKNEQGS